jgi:ribosome-associated translation inhibitor RaiA
MQVPLEIRYHHLDRSESLDEEIRQYVEKLERRFDRLVACRVAIEATPHQHRTGSPCEVHIELSVPGHKFMVTKEPHRPTENYHNADLRAVLKEAFQAAERQLSDFKRRQHDGAKGAAGTAMHGSVAQILPEQDHGFILTSAGVQLFFSRTSITSVALEALKIGDNVHYIERDGDNGPIASKVWLATAEEAAE